MPQHHRTESKSSPRRIAAKERQAQALELRKAGIDFATIAKQLGYRDSTGAYRAVTAALNAIPTEAVADYRKVNLERLQKLLFPLWRVAIGSDGKLDERIKAAGMCLAILAEQAKLLGLYAPTKVDITAYIEQIAEELGVEKKAAIEEAQRILSAHNR